MISKTLAHYEIEDRIGEGGSGVVYRGRDLRLERPVAIKVLADVLRDDELAWARLLREARLASQLNHPHIAAIYDLGEEDDCAYIVMEYVEGLPLADLIPEGGMPFEQVKRYAAQISDALDFAHQQGVIHGDLKGSNIVVTSEGNIKLLDFGLGRRIPRNGMAEVTNSHLPLAEGGTTAGTLPYLAPEVLRGDPTSLPSDVWALGVLLYQMATGELPFRGATPFELSVEIMTGTPRDMEKLPEPLQSTLRACMAMNPRERPARPRDVASALAGLALGSSPAPRMNDAPESANAADQPTMLPAAGRWRKWWVAGAAMVLIGLLAGFYARHVWVLWHAAQQVSQSDVLKNSATGNPSVKVWVNTDSGTYHCPGARWYGKTRNGEYLTQKEAQEKGFRPAASRACL